jgi:hypothetical protein
VSLPRRGTAFGNQVESELPLPLGPSPEGRAERPLWVRCGEPDRLYPSDRRLTRIGVPGEVTGVVSPRRRTVWVERAGSHPGALWGAVMGLSLPHLLCARGSVVLHASCAVRDGTAVAFLGRQRAGKSSIVAALLTEGWRLVADDSLVLTLAGDRVRAAPSFPALRLWTPLATALASALGLEKAAVHPAVDKQWVFLGQHLWSDRPAVELACLCILEGGDTVRIRGHETMLALLGAVYGPEPELKRNWRRWFDSARNLASSVPVLRLAAPAAFRPDFRFSTDITRQLRAARVL